MDCLPTLKNKLTEEYKYKIEMHAHTTPISPCSQVTPEEMARIYAQDGYDAVVITNHFIYNLLNELPKKQAIDKYISGYEYTCREAEKYQLKILLGAEIRFTENLNDYLIYGIDRNLLELIYDYLPLGIEKFRKEVKLDKSVFIQAHPFRDGIEKVNPQLLDGTEVFNMHPTHNSRIAIAAKHAQKNNFSIITAGSDFHNPGIGYDGISAVRTKFLPQNSFELANILKSGDYIMEIGSNIIF